MTEKIKELRKEMLNPIEMMKWYNANYYIMTDNETEGFHINLENEKMRILEIILNCDTLTLKEKYVLKTHYVEGVSWTKLEKKIMLVKRYLLDINNRGLKKIIEWRENNGETKQS